MKQDYTQQLNADEKVVILVRRHVIGLVAIVSSIILALVVLTAGFYLVGRYPDQVSRIGSPSAALAVLAILLLLVLLIGLAAYRIYRESYLLITDQNVIQFIQSGLLSGTTSQMKINEVEDAKDVQTGILANTFNYGDITVETAGAEDNFVFRFAPDPRRVVDTILDLSGKQPDTDNE